MTLIIGTDEAGYGPNLGPLVVAATAWRVEATPANAAVYLETAVAAAQRDTEALWPEKIRQRGNRRASGRTVPLWADSKHIYRAGAGFCALEQGVLVALSLVNDPDADTFAHAGHGGHAGHAGPVIRSPVNQTNTVPRQWPSLEAALGQIGPEIADCRTSGVASESGRDPSTTQWALLPTLCLPHQADADACCARAAGMRMILDALGVSLVAVACRAIYPAEFNALLCQGLNKSDILSRTTLALAASLRTKANAEPALIWCDRHGGRKHYSALVAQHFGGTLVQTLAETPARSAYRVPAQAKADPTHAKADLNQAQAANLDIEFNVGGESQVPVAVASMTAKYIRELAMHAFNAFWSSRSPGLNPTAGYPADALRWRCDARDAIAEAGVRDKDLWRSV
jgi:ribonuclease HII